MDSVGFRAPLDIPQDLLLIQDLVADHLHDSATKLYEKPHTFEKESDDIASSSSEAGDDEDNSEDEVMNLVLDPEIRGSSSEGQSLISSDGTSDSSSESSDSDSEEGVRGLGDIPALDDDGEFDDEEPVASSKAIPKTTHELEDGEEQILVPEHDFISSEEQLDRVGEIMSVQHHSVIVRGASVVNPRMPNPKTLDIETLLVFEDRSVLGYIHDIFGPTAQPLYIVKFPSSHPPLTGKPAVSTELAEGESMLDERQGNARKIPNLSHFVAEQPVFHVPNRSRFVFVTELAKQKGTDASNAHDEEPTGLDAMYFSDDEEEARWKRSLKGDKNTGDKRKRGESMPYSRDQTPAQMYDQQMGSSAFDLDFEAVYGSNPYDANGVYDNDVAVVEPSSSRKVIVYDDPYADNKPASSAQNEASSSRGDGVPAHFMRTATSPTVQHTPSARSNTFAQRGRGRGRGAGASGMERGRGRGRGRGGQQRGRGRGRGSFEMGGTHRRQNQSTFDSVDDGGHVHPDSSALSGEVSSGQRLVREMSPTSLAIARATGQYTDGSTVQPESSWQQGFEQLPIASNVQPHINPRFAAQWGMQIPSYWQNAYTQGEGQWSQWSDYSGGFEGNPYPQ